MVFHYLRNELYLCIILEARTVFVAHWSQHFWRRNIQRMRSVSALGNAFKCETDRLHQVHSRRSNENRQGNKRHRATHELMPCRINVFLQNEDVIWCSFPWKFLTSYTQNAYCAIKMLFKTAHTNIWLERFFMSHLLLFTQFLPLDYSFSLSFFLDLALSLFSLSLYRSRVRLDCRKLCVCMCDCVLKISALFHSWRKLLLVFLSSGVGRFFGVTQNFFFFLVKFVNKQIKVKDHIKRQYTINTLHMQPSKCTPKHATWKHHDDI